MNRIYQIFVSCRSYALRLIAITMLFVGPAVPLCAQTTLTLGDTWKTGALTNGDLLIPEGAEYLYVNIKGGDGGRVKFNGKNCSSVLGGEGAELKITFSVGTSGDKLRPGGRLRVYTGQAGGYDEHNCGFTGNASGGGGGSSAVLYLPPGAAASGVNWHILVIAGGGGGANRPSAGTRKEGQGGNPRDWGDYVVWGFDKKEGGQNGSGGEGSTGGPGFLDFSPGFPGYGYNSYVDNNELKRYIGSMVQDIDLTELGSNGEGKIRIKPKPTSHATNTGDNYACKGTGGNGFTGGGVGCGGGGGGGGSSGGAAHHLTGGGGGGSWFSEAFSPSSIGRTWGFDGRGPGNNGFVLLRASSAVADSLDFQLMPGGGAHDIAVGNDGSIWKISDETTPGGYKIYKYNGSKWELKNGGGTRIAVAYSGVPWMVNDKGGIFRATDANATNWVQLPGSAHDIAVDNNGFPWVIGTIPVVGGYSIHFWNGSKWNQMPGGAVRIGAGTIPWLVNNIGEIYRWDNGKWEIVSGWGADIGVNKNGQVFLVGESNDILHRVANDWLPTQIKGTSVSAGNGVLAADLSQIYGVLNP